MNVGALLDAVERGEQFIIARGQKAVARLLPAEDDGITDAEREEWGRAAMANLARAYGPEEPDYTPAAINRAVVPKLIDAANRCNLRHVVPKTFQKALYVGFSKIGQPLQVVCLGWSQFPIPEGRLVG